MDVAQKHLGRLQVRLRAVDVIGVREQQVRNRQTRARLGQGEDRQVILVADRLVAFDRLEGAVVLLELARQVHQGVHRLLHVTRRHHRHLDRDSGVETPPLRSSELRSEGGVPTKRQ